ncbi:MAG: glutathione peroxidase [Alkalinema sp. CAN_BIN05]|nr:glutathione peroxidase [Alkalinema sp. CAN_BIN05]
MVFQNREGQKVPSVTFRARENGEWVDVKSDDLFAGRTVAVFSLPGAFTPTCSSTHVPGYNQLAPAFHENGIDEIVCLSVNDGFVMEEWSKDQQAENVRFIPDGNGQFTDGMGLLVDKADLGFGKRSWRYSMIVKDGVVDKMFIEPEEPGDPFKVSDAETMLNHINPNAVKPKNVFLFTKKDCPFCAKAKAMLSDRGMSYEEISVGKDVSSKALKAATGALTVPQIFIDGTLIGGSDDLEAYFA